MTEQDLLMQELRMENEELHRTVYDLRRENDELRRKYENEQLCYISEMCDHERLKQVQRISVSEIGLPERTWHALRRYGIHDVDIIQLSVSKLNSKHNFDTQPAPWIITGKAGE